MVEEARRRHPDTPVTDILDCADAPGRAMAALRIGQRLLVLERCPAWTEVASAAAGLGAVLLEQAPPALDLATRGAAMRLPAWLIARGDSSSRVS